MAEEDTHLSVTLQKLIISKKNPVEEETVTKTNPFARRNKTRSNSASSIFGPSRSCRVCRKRRRISFFQRINKNGILRGPGLVYRKCRHIPLSSEKPKDSEPNESSVPSVVKKEKLFGENTECQDFKSIIAGCQQLSLSSTPSTSSGVPSFSSQSFRESRTQTPQTENKSSVSTSCSQQAMVRLCLNPPCDVTIDELASYFETFVHIPKKMSSMAEMMYI